jgi:hypothetical protein
LCPQPGGHSALVSPELAGHDARMEFQRIPGESPAAPAVDHAEQLQQMLRLMAQRSLHGARGILFLAGSLLLVLAGVSLGYEPMDANGLKSGFKIWDNLTAGRMGMDEWMAVGDLALGAVTLLCGALVTRMPRAATLLPAVLFAVKIAAMIFIAARLRVNPGMILPVFQLLLTGLTLRAFRDARAFHRDAEAARSHYRSMSILRQKEARDQLAPASALPENQRAGTRLPPPKRHAAPPDTVE